MLGLAEDDPVVVEALEAQAIRDKEERAKLRVARTLGDHLESGAKDPFANLEAGYAPRGDAARRLGRTTPEPKPEHLGNAPKKPAPQQKKPAAKPKKPAAAKKKKTKKREAPPPSEDESEDDAAAAPPARKSAASATSSASAALPPTGGDSSSDDDEPKAPQLLLCKAAKAGNVDELRRLLDAGAKIDETDGAGRTALMFVSV